LRNGVGLIAASLLRSVALSLSLVLAGCATYHARPLLPQRSAESFSSRTLSAPQLRIFMRSRFGHPVTPWPPKAWTFSQLTAAALYYQPRLPVARARQAMARADAVTADAYPNPSLRLDPFPQFTTNAGSGVSPWTIGLAVEVSLVTAGKRSQRAAEALAEAEAARFDVVQTAWEVRTALRAPLIKLYGAERRLKLLRGQVADAAKLVQALRQRFKAGQTSEFQVVQARLQWNRARLRCADAETEVSQGRADVAGALGVPVSALAGVSLDLAGLYDLPPLQALAQARFRTWALTRRPDVRAALMHYAASEQALKIVIASQYPNLQVGPGYTWDQGAHQWAIGFSLSLPVFNQNQGPVARARAQREALASRFRALQAQIANHLDRAMATYRARGQKLQLARKLLAAGRARIRSAKAAYQAGEKSRVDLLRIRLETQSDRLAMLEARMEAAQARGDLEDTLEHPLGRRNADSQAIEDVGASGKTRPEKPPREKSSP